MTPVDIYVVCNRCFPLVFPFISCSFLDLIPHQVSTFLSPQSQRYELLPHSPLFSPLILIILLKAGGVSCLSVSQHHQLMIYSGSLLPRCLCRLCLFEAQSDWGPFAEVNDVLGGYAVSASQVLPGPAA